MSDAAFYYESNGQQLGPISAAELKAKAVSGELKPTDMVWKEGLPDWVSAGSVRGLFPEGTVIPPRPAASATAGDISRQAAAAAKEAAQQSLGAVKILVSDPVGGLGKAYEALGSTKALTVGIAFLLVYIVSYLITGIFISDADLVVPWASIKGYEPNMVRLLFGSGFEWGGYFKGLLLVAVFAAALIGALALFRMMLKSTAGIAADLFIIGASLVPVGLSGLLVALLMKILQPGWFGSVVYLGIYVAAHCIMIFMLFSGLTKIIGMTERKATIYMPLMFVCGVLIFASLSYLMSSGGGGPPARPTIQLPPGLLR